MSLLEKIFQECLLVNPEHTYIITGAYHRAVASKVNRDRLIYNPDYDEGMASSLRLVSKTSAQLGLDAVVIILSDHPFVNHHMLDATLKAMRSSLLRKRENRAHLLSLERVTTKSLQA